MTSVHPQIVIEEKTPAPSQENQTQSKIYYFQTKSGKVTKIQTDSEQNAVNLYLSQYFPKFEMPYNDTFCCGPIFVQGECNGVHCPKYTHYLGISNWVLYPYEKFNNYSNFYNNLLKRYPDFFSSGRYEEMYNEMPTLTQGDFQTSMTKADGTTVYWNPRSFTYFWQKANIRFITSHVLEYPFDYVMRKLAAENPNQPLQQKCHKVCQSVVYTNYPLFTADDWDFLEGSLKPTTELPTPPAPLPAEPAFPPATGPVEELAQEESRLPSRVLRQRKGKRRQNGRIYEAIQISETT